MKIAASLGILRIENLRVPSKSLILDIISFGISLLLFYNATLLLINYMNKGSLDMMFFFGNPILLLLSIPVLICIWTAVGALLKKIVKSGIRVILIISVLLIIIPAVFSTSLNYGILDSVELLEDSVIDLSYCTAMLHIKNNGLTEVHVLSVEIGKLICDFSSYPWLGTVKPGESEVLHVYYAYKQFVWGLDQFSPYPSGPQYNSNLQISPTTFKEGKIPVIIHTDGVLSYKFDVEAKFSKPEEIYDFQVNIFNLNKESDDSLNCYLPDMTLIFNMSQDAVALVYFVKIGNLTLQLIYPPMVQGYECCNHFSISLDPDYHIWVNGWPAGQTMGVISNHPINVPIFEIGKTYTVVVQTMANNNYTTQIKMVD